MSYREDEPYITDQITIDLLREIPELSRKVFESLGESADFMKELGQYHPTSGPLNKIRIIMWTPNKIIHDLDFGGGLSLSDLVMSFGEGFPVSLMESLLLKPCIATLGHPIFEGYRWEEESFNERGDRFRIDAKSDIILGMDPLAGLKRVLMQKDYAQASLAA